MKKHSILFGSILIAGLMVTAASPVHAWWGGNDWDDWGGGPWGGGGPWSGSGPWGNNFGPGGGGGPWGNNVGPWGGGGPWGGAPWGGGYGAPYSGYYGGMPGMSGMYGAPYGMSGMYGYSAPPAPVPATPVAPESAE